MLLYYKLYWGYLATPIKYCQGEGEVGQKWGHENGVKVDDGKGDGGGQMILCGWRRRCLLTVAEGTK